MTRDGRHDLFRELEDPLLTRKNTYIQSERETDKVTSHSCMQHLHIGCWLFWVNHFAHPYSVHGPMAKLFDSA